MSRRVMIIYFMNQVRSTRCLYDPSDCHIKNTAYKNRQFTLIERGLTAAFPNFAIFFYGNYEYSTFTFIFTVIAYKNRKIEESPWTLEKWKYLRSYSQPTERIDFFCSPDEHFDKVNGRGEKKSYIEGMH